MKRLLTLSVLLAMFAYLPGLLGQAQAECGPGPLVVQNKKGSLLQSFGATTNASFLPTQTFAITSGTSGCSNSGIIKKDVEQRLFVAVHMDNIYQEMAQGGGSHLDALASLMGCQTVSYGRFAGVTRHNLGRLFPAGEVSPVELLARLKQTMRGDAALAQGCSRIS